MPTFTVDQVQAKTLQDALAEVRTVGARMRCLLENAPLKAVAEFAKTNTMYKFQVFLVWESEDKAERLLLFRTNSGSPLGILLWDKSVPSLSDERVITLEVLSWNISYNVFRASDKPGLLKEIAESTIKICNEANIQMVFSLGAFGFDGLVHNTDTVFLEARTFFGFSETYDASDHWIGCIDKENSRALEFFPLNERS